MGEQVRSNAELVKSKTDQESQLPGQPFQKPGWYNENLKSFFKYPVGIVKIRKVLLKTWLGKVRLNIKYDKHCFRQEIDV
ncbi:hypothetical protein A4R26_00660 [Niastella populi]|uniref:Uncharacterized protein n=1 Tax=Niastella populi TaxID=550983 RepID=A0A1V9GCQ6_9BACT|nr:hypothetical protein A4R26_00660 [Niastella populi]